ncbi:MAG: hypothetical protein WC505_01825 [Patescibacteria group bacterium]
MNSALQWLNDALDQVDLEKAQGPTNEIDKDHQLGDMSEDLKRLFVVMTEQAEAADTLSREIEHLTIDVRHDPSKQDELGKKCLELSLQRSRMKAAEGLFWAQIHADLNGTIPAGVYALIGGAGWKIGYQDCPSGTIMVEMRRFDG